MNDQAKQAELKFGSGGLALDGFDTNEDDLLDMISSLEDRLGDVRELQQERLHLEDELEAMRREIEAREAELEEREQIIEDSSTEVFTEREMLEAQKRLMLEEQAQLEARRRELEAKEAQVSEEFASVQSLREQLEAAQAALAAERQKREEEARAIQREQSELAQREQELAAHNSSNESVSPEMAQLAEQLAQAQKQAEERAREAQAKAEAARKRAEAMEARCRELSSECEIVRTELEGSRAQIRQVKAEMPERVLRAQLKEQKREQTQKSIVTAASWICTGVAFGAATLAGLNGAAGDAGLMLGIAFAAYYVGAQAIAGKLLDPPSIVIGAIGGSFGLWFPMWANAVAQAMVTWSLPTDGLPASMVSQLPMSISVATAGLTMTVGIFALTWSGRLLFSIGAASLLAGALAMFPASAIFAFGAGAVLWHAVTGSGLSRWALQASSDDSSMEIARSVITQPPVKNFRVM